MTRFDELALQPNTRTALQKMGFETATPIQAQSIPLLLEGRDLIAQARTGTGKTAAFGIPLVEGVAYVGTPDVLALVLVPTRELALQVAEELAKLAVGTHDQIVALYGGAGFGDQLRALQRSGPKAVVATPGRLLDHMERKTIRLDTVRMLVLDEADRMLDMGFLPDVERIIRALPRDRMTALFSATMPPAIQKLAQRFMHEPSSIQADTGPEPVALAEQFRIDVPAHGKADLLHGLLTHEKASRTIVFTRTKHRARSLARVLERQGWGAVALQGNMTQSQRERAIASFRQNQANVLVATDVASRGLDVPEVSHVVNYDMPDEPEAYVHRVGRTARMGRTGRAFTFVQPDQMRDAQSLQRAVRVDLKPFEVPNLVLPAAPPRAENGSHHEPRGRGPQRSQGGRRSWGNQRRGRY